MSHRPIVAAVALTLAMAGCDPLEPVVPSDATVRVLLTDASTDYLDHAEVDLGAVQLIDSTGAAVELTADATSDYVDLLELPDRLSPLELADVAVASGGYETLVVAVEGARVDLALGYAFPDGSTVKDLAVPTGAASGMSLNLDIVGGQDDIIGAINIAGGVNDIVLDFDVNQSFIIEGEPDGLEGITDVFFTPAIRVAVGEVAGSISGTVSGESSSGVLVVAYPLKDEAVGAYQTRRATTRTASDGSYTLPFLAPGSYAVDVVADSGLTTNPAITETTVGEGEDITGVDFQIVSSS